MTTVEETRGAWDRLADWWFSLSPMIRLATRWVLILGLTTVAFWTSLVNLWHTTVEGGLIGYMWMVPIVCAVAAIGIDFRQRTELPIHDRQTDVIVGIIGLGLALMVQGVLLKRYSEFFYLLRLDLFAMWVFVLSSAVVLFGIRPVTRFGWVWLLMGLSSALPYQVVVIVLGGGKLAAGVGTLLIATGAAAIAFGFTRRQTLIGAATTFVIGLVILLLVDFLAPDAPVIAYQMIPSLAAIIVVGAAVSLYRRRNLTKILFKRSVEPLAAKQIWSAIPLVVAVGVALTFMPLPAQTAPIQISRDAPFDLVPGRELAAPPGWKITDVQVVKGVSRYYGEDALLVRQWMTADVGDPRFDKLSAPRTLVVDSIVSELPFSFEAYPAQVLYDTTAARLSSQRPVDLGNGVTGRLVSAVDDRLLVTWDVMRFAWGNKDREQVVDIFAVDNHLPDAPFPNPQRGLTSTLRNLLTVLFRGNAVLMQSRPSFKDEVLLTEFGRALVTAQVEHAGDAR